VEKHGRIWKDVCVCVCVCACVCVCVCVSPRTRALTCVEAVVVSGAVAMNGEGGAREGAGVGCWDNSELVPPMAPSPVTDDDDGDPSALQNTPEGRDEQSVIPQDRTAVCRVESLI